MLAFVSRLIATTMGVFITTSNTLVPKPTTPTNKVTEKELSRHLTAILKAHKKCNEVNILNCSL